VIEDVAMLEIDRQSLQNRVGDHAKEVASLLKVDTTVGEAIVHIRTTQGSEPNIFYFYVVDENKRLLGTVSTRDLLIASPESPLSELVNTRVEKLQSDQTMAEGWVLMQKFHILALPVVEHGKLIGVLTVQDYFREGIPVQSARKRLEIFQTFGFFLEEGKRKSTWVQYKTRAPWLFCNMLGGLACAVISNIYTDVLLKVIVLAMFIPLVLSLSESISMQAMTQTIHYMSRIQNFWKNAFSYLLHESKLFILVGLTSGVMIGLVSHLWDSNWTAGIIIGISIIITVFISALIGALMPPLVHSIKLDPKIASGPVVLMLVDTITTLVYLSIAYAYLF